MTSFSSISGPSSILGRSLSTSSLSTVQKQVDSVVTDFTAQATDLQTLVALTAGGYASRLGKFATLSAGSRYLSGLPSLVRIGSLGIGLAGESATFAGIQRTFRTFDGQNPTQGFGKEWLNAAISLGSLKFFGRLAEGQNLALQHLFSDFGMVGAHNVASFAGIEAKPEGDLFSQFLHAEAMNWQMKAGMSLVHGLAPRLSATERAMDLSLKSREESLGTPSSGVFNPLSEDRNLATEGVPSAHHSKSLEGKGEKPTLLAMASQGASGGKGLLRKDYPHTEEKTFETPKGSYLIKLFSREPFHDSKGLVEKFGLSFTDLLFQGNASFLKGSIAELIRKDDPLRTTLQNIRFKSFELQFDVQTEEILCLRMHQGEVRLEISVPKASSNPPAADREEIQEKLKTPLDRSQGWSGKTFMLFQRLNLQTVGQLRELREEDLLKQKNVGRKTVQEIKRILSETFGLSWGWDRLESLDRPLRSLGLTLRAENALKHLGLVYVGDLVQRTPEELKRTRNVGPNILKEIQRTLEAEELSLGMTVDWNPPEKK